MLQADEEPLPIPVPKFNLPVIEAKREQLATAIIDYVGTELVGDQFSQLALDLQEQLPGVDVEVIARSLYTLVGTTLTKAQATQTAWRLAGNLTTLKKGEPVGPWTRQDHLEWIPLQVIEVLPGRNHRKEFGSYVHTRVLAGTACPMRLQTFWNNKKCAFMASRLGFSRPYGKSKVEKIFYNRPVELTNMRLLGLLEPELTRDGRPGFWRVTCTPGLLSWNKRLLLARAHIDPPCPEGYNHQCYQCPIGYDRCPAGCHPNTWEWKVCPECEKKGWCDPGHPRFICINCEIAGK
jgi:hypothetical protein